jgi:hypothetical protein
LAAIAEQITPNIEYIASTNFCYNSKNMEQLSLQEMGDLLTKTLVTKMHTVMDVSL